MARTLKVLSALLSYPTQELQGAGDALRSALRDEPLLPDETQKHLQQLIGEIAVGDLYDLQERYVDLFDRGRSLSLYLFEHVHGESRDRGQAT
jgi:nitrate reductase delta subunit